MIFRKTIENVIKKNNRVFFFQYLITKYTMLDIIQLCTHVDIDTYNTQTQ